jgi:hypothetical protein
MDIKAYFVKRLAGVGNMLGILVLTSAAMIGTAQAQNVAATSSHASLSGIQSVIIHARDSMQRRLRVFRLRSHGQRLPEANPPPH